MPAVASESLAKHYILSTPYILMLPLKPYKSPMLICPRGNSPNLLPISWYKHFHKQKHYRPRWMRIISSCRRGWTTRSEFPKRSVVVSCWVCGNEMVAFHARQRISRVLPSILPRLPRKAANFVEFRLWKTLFSFLVLSQYINRLGAKAKAIWIARIC